MANFYEAYKNLEKLAGGLFAMYKNVFQKKERTILDRNIHQHVEQGIRADELPLLPEYSEYTKKIKREKGQRIDHVTLEDTELFHKSMNFYPFERGVYVNAPNVPYSSDLIERYGIEIFGLTDESKNTIKDELKDELLKEFKQTIKLK